MNEERLQILEMLATGKIDVAETQMLLEALEKGAAVEPEALKAAHHAKPGPGIPPPGASGHALPPVPPIPVGLGLPLSLIHI